MNENGQKNAKENATEATHLAAPSPISGTQLRVGKGIGGKKGRSGRPRNEVRDMLINEFVEQMPKLKREIGKKGKITRKEFADLCAKYGLGTTITETDTDGNDVERPQVIAYIPTHGRFLGN